MNEELLKRWSAALRSGNYRQGRGRLRDLADKYCPLGVLFDLVKDEVDGYWEQTVSINYLASVPGESRYYCLPLRAMYSLHLDPTILNNVIVMNDDRHNTFTEIADYIDFLVESEEET